MIRSRALLWCCLLSLVLAGCSLLGPGRATPQQPGGSDPTPTDLFTGEPTILVVELAFAGVSPMSISDDEGTNEKATVRISRRESARGPEIYVGYHEVDLDGEPLVVEAPAEQGYLVEVLAYDSQSRDLLGTGESKADAMAKTINSVSILIDPPTYELTKPDYMFSGGSLAQWSISTPDSRLNADVLLGLNPWTQNDIQGLWQANGDGEGWVHSIHGGQSVPAVDEPTPLYYQVRVCSKTYMFQDGSTWVCRYYPDLESETGLSSITIYPDPFNWP